MIDIENSIMTKVYNAVIASYPTASVYGEKTNVPASFPCVTVEETTNDVYKRTLDSTGTEHHARLQYTINVYSAKSTGKKAEAKAIASIIDTTMQNIGFVRSMSLPTSNIDPTVYRIVMQYTGVVAEGITSGNTTTYYVHRL